MAEIKNGLLLNNDRVFLPSTDINVFPCSRRGQANIEDVAIENSATYYDPEARLNTERTNRLHTALNGFTNSFIKSYDAEAKTLIFVLAGYYVEIKNFDPAIIASTLGEGVDKIYAHLRLHDHVSLNVKDYFTEMLYRQSESELDANYLDVTYTINGDHGDFFVGVSFTKELVEGTATHNLQLFSYVNDTWKQTPASLLPKIEHGETENSVKVSGDFTADTVNAKNRLSVPVIDTKVIENTVDDTGINVNDALNIKGDLAVEGSISQKIRGDYYNVPVIVVQQLYSADSNEYQLQISRANVLPYQNTEVLKTADEYQLTSAEEYRLTVSPTDN